MCNREVIARAGHLFLKKPPGKKEDVIQKVWKMSTEFHVCFVLIAVGLLFVTQTITIGLVICSDTLERRMYISSYEIRAIKAKVQAGEEPWKTAYDEMILDANAALSAGPYSVTFSDLNPSNPHDYRTESAYSGWSRPPPYGDGQEPDYRDGQINPGADREDYFQATAVGHAVRDLGLAYAFTDDSKYADRAIELIRVWCLDSSTKMNPTYTNHQSEIEISITIPGIFYGADLIHNYPGWSSSEKSAFRDWVAALAASAMNWSSITNYENWRVNFIASSGALLNDESLLTYAFDRYKAIIPEQINSKGEMVRELGRTKSLSYSVYAINAMIQTAEIARLRGVDLYEFTSDGSRGLKLALDYHAYYAVHPDEWAYEQIAPLKAYEVAFYELAYSFWQEPLCREVINKWGRPMTEIRILGPVSLTHANRFEQEKLLPADLNNDGIVNIRDMGIVALAFGSYPGHPRWNSIADLDESKEINIIDIARATRDFGKTVEE